jgi:hypothetical protein
VTELEHGLKLPLVVAMADVGDVLGRVKVEMSAKKLMI